MAIQIIDIAGLKKSGKTTVIENLVKELKRKGYKVGTLKKIHTPGFTIDQPGKDTYRHKQAGADFVISVANDEIAMIKRQDKKMRLEGILELVPKDTEFFICEELNESFEEILYIITLKDKNMLKETLRVRNVGKNVIAISGVISNYTDKYEKYPVINSITKKGRKTLVEMILQYRKN